MVVDDVDYVSRAGQNHCLYLGRGTWVLHHLACEPTFRGEIAGSTAQSHPIADIRGGYYTVPILFDREYRLISGL